MQIKIEVFLIITYDVVSGRLALLNLVFPNDWDLVMLSINVLRVIAAQDREHEINFGVLTKVDIKFGVPAGGPFQELHGHKTVHDFEFSELSGLYQVPSSGRFNVIVP